MAGLLIFIGICYVIYKLSSEAWENSNGYVPPTGTHTDQTQMLCDIALGKKTGKQANKDMEKGMYNVKDK